MAVRDRGFERWPKQCGSAEKGRDWARLSADRLVQRLRREAEALRARCAALESALSAYAGGPLEPGSLQDRLLASAPALDAELRGEPVAGTRRLRRNTSWHAALTPKGGFVHAVARDLRAVQRGPRLGSVESLTVQGGMPALNEPRLGSSPGADGSAEAGPSPRGLGTRGGATVVCPHLASDLPSSLPPSSPSPPLS